VICDKLLAGKQAPEKIFQCLFAFPAFGRLEFFAPKASLDIAREPGQASDVEFIDDLPV
jgi:hypothetical protein